MNYLLILMQPEDAFILFFMFMVAGLVILFLSWLFEKSGFLDFVQKKVDKFIQPMPSLLEQEPLFLQEEEREMVRVN